MAHPNSHSSATVVVIRAWPELSLELDNQEDQISLKTAVKFVFL